MSRASHFEVTLVPGPAHAGITRIGGRMFIRRAGDL